MRQDTYCGSDRRDRDMIEFHADDYGISIPSGDRILRCYEEGVLNGISLMPNGESLKECMKRYFEAVEKRKKKCLLSVHINLYNGYALTERKEVPHLTDGDDLFTVTFGKLLFWSCCPVLHGIIKKEIKNELRSQIGACLPYFKKTGQKLRIDGHCHFTMTPIVYDALQEVIREDGLSVEYIRFPVEDVKLYRKMRPQMEEFLPVNRLKAGILHMLAKRNLKKWKTGNLRKKKYAGVMLSGRMTLKNVTAILSYIEENEKERDWEIAFHPGAIYEEEDRHLLTAKGDVDFITSRWREKEAEALIALRKRGYGS